MKKNTKDVSKLLVNLIDILEFLPAHVYIKDLEGRMIASNELNSQDLFQKSSHEIIGKNDFDLQQDKEVARLIVENDKKVLEMGVAQSFEEVANLPNGLTLFYASSKIPLRDKEGKIEGLLGISIDITAKKRDELEKEHLFDTIINLLPGHVYIKNLKGVITASNESNAQDIFHKSRPEVIGKSDFDLMQDKEHAYKIMENDRKVLEMGFAQTFEEPSILPNGKVATFLSSKIPFKDSSGNITGLLGISIDITKLKETQAALKNAELRLEGMRLVSASIAHELRTPLASIRSAVEFLSNYVPILVGTYKLAQNTTPYLPMIKNKHLEELNQIAENINASINQANMFIDMSLTNLSFRSDESHFKKCSILECVRIALDNYPFETGERELVEFDESQDAYFFGSIISITHVLYNLIKNALYFIKAARKGKISIWITQTEKYNELHFKDTAKGISPEHLPQIFDQFFTKDTHHGSGIGLAYSKMCMHEHHGDIICRSEEGHYAEFILMFPFIK